MIAKFPVLTLEQRGRRIFFETEPDIRFELEDRGYEVVVLNTLPRNSVFEEQYYLKAKLQGIEEGTVVVDKIQMDALKSQIDLNFGKKAFDGVLQINKANAGILDMLDWNASRHTIQGNTTMALARANPLDLKED